jgi:hypothetical protein
LLSGIVLPALLATHFAAIPFLIADARAGHGGDPLLLPGSPSSPPPTPRSEPSAITRMQSDPVVAAQLARQKQAEIDYMRQPFQPESSVPAKAASAAVTSPS